MKLRNKTTGEIVECPMIRVSIGVCNLMRYEFPDSLAALNKEWEDYKPKEPLIKDELARKAIRAWAEANSILGDEKVEVTTPTIDCCVLGLTHGFTSIDLIIDEEVAFKNHGRYTIDELCGEETPEPLEPNFVDLDERIREKAATEKLYEGENDMHLREEEE